MQTTLAFFSFFHTMSGWGGIADLRSLFQVFSNWGGIAGIVHAM
jgi:hypothetical protein